MPEKDKILNIGPVSPFSEPPEPNRKRNIFNWKINTTFNPEEAILNGLNNRKWMDKFARPGHASGMGNLDAPLQQEHPSLALLPFAPEIMGSGVGLGVLKTLGGYAGGYVNGRLGKVAGRAIDETFNTGLFEPTLELAGDFIGFGKGYNALNKIGTNRAFRWASKTGKSVPNWFMRPELRTTVEPINQRTIFAEDQTPKYNSSQIGNGNRRVYQSPTTFMGMYPRKAVAYAEEIPVENFERLVSDFPVNGKGNVELWEAAGVNTSKFPKDLSETLRKMQYDRLRQAVSGKSDSIINVADKNRITSYFNVGTTDNRLGYIDVEGINDNDLGVRWIQKIQSLGKHGLDPYTAIGLNAAKQYADVLGKGLVSGRELLKPEKTINHTSSYFNIQPVLQKQGDYLVPVPGKYHEDNLREAIIRQWMQNNPGRTPSQKELDFLFNKANEGTITALEDKYLNVSSFPEYFDISGNFRSDLPEDLIDELSIYLSEGRPGFYQRYIGPLKRPLVRPNKLITPFIHPNLYLYPGEHPNLGIFSTFKNGGKLKIK